LQQRDPVIFIHQVGQQFVRFGIADDRSRRHLQHQVVAAGPGLVLGSSMITVFGPEVSIFMEADQAVKVGADGEDDVTTTAAVAAAGSAQRHMFLATEADHPVAPVAALYVYFCLIIKHRSRLLIFQQCAQHGHSGVDVVHLAIAVAFIQILAALDANAFAPLPAIDLHRNFQQAQFAHQGRQI